MSMKDAMNYMAKHEDVIFLGQNIVYPKNQMFDSLDEVPAEKKIEMPVAEEMQTGVALGMAMRGLVPVSIYPRWDFLILAANQIVNHIDKAHYLCSNFNKIPKVIIRTAVGGKWPLDAGPQHTQDHTYAFQQMCETINVRYLEIGLDDPVAVYRSAYYDTRSSIIVERKNDDQE